MSSSSLSFSNPIQILRAQKISPTQHEYSSITVFLNINYTRILNVTGKIQLFPPKIRGHYQITEGHAIIFRGLFRKCNWKLWRLKNCQCSEITFSSFVSPFRTLETTVWSRPWGNRTFCEADQLIEHFPFNRLSSSLLSALVSTEICCMSKEIDLRALRDLLTVSFSSFAHKTFFCTCTVLYIIIERTE